MKRFINTAWARALPLGCTTQKRTYLFPTTPPPVPQIYLPTDSLEFVIKTEARNQGMDDTEYMRELAFVRIHDNPSVGDFVAMTPEGRREMFQGSGRPDFFMEVTFKLLGKPELLYHHDEGIEL